MRAGTTTAGVGVRSPPSLSPSPPPSGHEPRLRNRVSAHSFSPPSRLVSGSGRKMPPPSVAARACITASSETGPAPPTGVNPRVRLSPALRTHFGVRSLAPVNPPGAGMRTPLSHHHWCKRRRSQGRIVSRERFSCATAAADAGAAAAAAAGPAAGGRGAYAARKDSVAAAAVDVVVVGGCSSGCGSSCARRWRRWRRRRCR